MIITEQEIGNNKYYVINIDGSAYFQRKDEFSPTDLPLTTMEILINKLCAELLKSDVSTKYEELIHAVGNKYPHETRHETALRYIRQTEKHTGGPAKEAQQ